MVNISEIKQRADIRDVWCALGGGKLRQGRGQAFWRHGDGYNIALDSEKGVWYDHRDDAGGDVVSLVETARQCSFLEAAEWLAAHTGVRASTWIRQDAESHADWATDLKWATWWGRAAEMLAEEALEELPSWSSQRRGPTVLLQTIRLGDAALVGEYVEWRRRFPELTTAMAQAGKRSDARLQRRLALWIRSNSDGG